MPVRICCRKSGRSPPTARSRAPILQAPTTSGCSAWRRRSGRDWPRWDHPCRQSVPSVHRRACLQPRLQEPAYLHDQRGIRARDRAERRILRGLHSREGRSPDPVYQYQHWFRSRGLLRDFQYGSDPHSGYRRRLILQRRSDLRPTTRRCVRHREFGQIALSRADCRLEEAIQQPLSVGRQLRFIKRSG